MPLYPPPAGAGYTDEQVRDVMNAALTSGAGIVITPNDGSDTVSVAAGGVVARGVIVVTGSEARPAGGDVVIWVNPDDLTVVNAAADDVIITPGSGGGGGVQTAPSGGEFNLFPYAGFDTGFQGGWINMQPLWLTHDSTWDRISIRGWNNGDDADDSTGVLKAGLYSVAGAVGSSGTLLHNFGTTALATLTDGQWVDWSGGPWAVPAGLYYLAFGAFNMAGGPRFFGTLPALTGFSYNPGIPGKRINDSHKRWIMEPGASDTLPTTTGTLNTNGGGENSYFPAVWIRTD